MAVQVGADFPKTFQKRAAAQKPAMVA
jgi:hypothetical protein